MIVSKSWMTNSGSLGPYTKVVLRHEAHKYFEEVLRKLGEVEPGTPLLFRFSVEQEEPNDV